MMDAQKRRNSCRCEPLFRSRSHVRPAPVAQWIERMPPEHEAARSNRVRRATVFLGRATSLACLCPRVYVRFRERSYHSRAVEPLSPSG